MALRCRKACPCEKVAAKNDLGEADREATFAPNDHSSEISKSRQIAASGELFHFRISAFSVSALPQLPPFTRPPLFLALQPSPRLRPAGRSGVGRRSVSKTPPTAFSGAPRQKQIPNNQKRWETHKNIELTAQRQRERHRRPRAAWQVGEAPTTIGQSGQTPGWNPVLPDDGNAS